jgi:ribosomal peptide maturation radical SAM protein 1
MPFSSLHYPSIGLSLLKPGLAQVGVACDLRYLFLDYADRVGAQIHDFITDSATYQSLIGEWIFAPYVHPELADGLDYLTEVFRKHYPGHYSADRLYGFLEAREVAGAFLDDCLDRVDWGAYAIAGFTTSFQQNMASLALARRVKERFPDLLIAFGGANCRGDMGIELHRTYGFIDAVCLDEGDRVFPEFVRRYIENGDIKGRDLGELPGMVVRRNGVTAVPGTSVDLVADMDSLPYPDFSDFFDQHARSPVASAHYPAVALFETSRGCWWGAKHHCTFCGINGLSMAYRSKSQTRAYDEIAHIARTWGPDLINVDAILDYRYFDELLPRLAAEGPEIIVYYELKTNLSPEQLTLLSRAGIKKIQPGIESLDSEILALMNKGCTMLQNVQTLKLAAENGLYVEWNLLYGFPGETPEHYARINRLMPKLYHLQAPSTFGEVRADRFSPYYSRPGDFGVTVRPNEAYRHIYPFDNEVIARLAYHFDIFPHEPPATRERLTETEELFDIWRARQRTSSLTAEEAGDRVIVCDDRWGAPPSNHRLQGAEAAILMRGWKIASWRAICHALAGQYPQAALDDALARLDDLGLVIVENGYFLSLALRQPGFASAPSWAEVRCSPQVPYALMPYALMPYALMPYASTAYASAPSTPFPSVLADVAAFASDSGTVL